MKKPFLIILTLIVIIGVIFAIIKGKNAEGKAKEVTVDTVAVRTIIETVTASGKIFAQEEVKISSDVSGEIVSLPVKEGQEITKGQLLCKIQPESYQALLEQSEAQYNNALANEKNMQASLANARPRQKQVQSQLDNAKLAPDRATDLYNKKSVSKADLENAQAAYKSAQAEADAIVETIKGAQYSIEGAQATVKGAQATIKDARSNLAKTSIFAPMNGTISLLNMELGEKVVGTLQMTGTEIMRISNLNNIEVRVDVSENEIVKVKIGDTADVEVDAYLGRKFKGIVTQVANSSQGTSASALTTDQSTNFTVRILILPESYADLTTGNKKPFFPGMSATADIRTKRVDNVITLPIQGVTTREKSKESKDMDEVVFVMINGNAVKRIVKTGIQDDKYIQVLDSLQAGDKVIVGPYDLLSKTLENDDAVMQKKEEKKKE